MTANNISIYRIVAGFLMFGMIVWGYWWILWPLAIIFLFIFPSYYEIIAWGAVYDALYGVSMTFSLAGIGLFLLAFFLKKYLFAYE